MPPHADSLATLLAERHSCRAFLPASVPRATLARILEMAQRTPSWCNTQPWEVVITSGEATVKFRDAMLAVSHLEPSPDFAWPAKYHGVYQERRGILHGPAKDLTPELASRIQGLAKRVYRTLELDGYARIDFRLAADGTPYFLEANPNPEIAESQEFATAARHVGINYSDLLHRIVALGMRRGRTSIAAQ